MKREKLLLTVTVNPSIDKTVEIEKFRYGEMNRIIESRSCMAGKGYHAAVVNKKLGGDSFCLGFSFSHNRMMTEKYFITNNVANEFVEIAGDTRVNLKLFDRDTSIITEINDKGKSIDENQLHNLYGLIRRYLKVGDMIVLSGSVQPGIPDTIYSELITEAKTAGLKTVLDAEGSLLEKGIESVPYLVRLNAYEIERSYGRIITNFSDAADMCSFLTEKGIKIACVSMGHKGAVISDGKNFWCAEAPGIEILSTVGAGGSMTGAICNSVLKNNTLDIILRSGIAAAAATSMLKDNELCSRESFEELYKQVKPVKM